MPDLDETNGRDAVERSMSVALTQLPLLAPPSDQFARIAIGIAQRKRRRLQRRVVLFAAAAALAVAAILPFAGRESATPSNDIARGEPTTSSNVAADDRSAKAATEPVPGASRDASDDLIARNQWLEAMVRAQGEPMDAASAYASAELEDLIGMVDVQLSATEEPKRQAALWEQRLSLMQELASVRTQGLAVVRDDDALMPASYRID